MESAITGNLGEHLAARFLREKGFNIVETNYWRKWGEIDIIAEKDDVLHFVEVKATGTVSRETKNDEYRPEENIRLWKKQRMSRAIRTYLSERKIPEEKEFEICVIALNLDFSHKKAKLRFIRNVVFE